MSGLLTPDALARDLSLRDLTRPEAGPHALQLLVDDAVAALTAAWCCESVVVRDHPVVSLDDNYDRLGYAADAVAREVRYTRYVSETCVLRSHTSAVIPHALRDLASRMRTEWMGDVLVACPGIVYRRDAIDRLHSGTPHQLDLWRVSRRRMSEADLAEMIAHLVDAVLPGAEWRTTPADHPYTLHGRQVDVRMDGGGEWVEIAECGIAGPHVLQGAGLPTTDGLALGLGLDRVLMLRKGIPDIRLLRSDDPRVADQMLDLAPYRPVSTMPPLRRDLSIAVDGAMATDAEVIGDAVRDALGADALAVESVEILADSPYAAVPAAARERIGMRAGQRNLLVRVVLRPVDRTLTDAEANELRDRIYAALHEGDRHQWAGR